MWPLDTTNRSRSSQPGSLGLWFILCSYRQRRISTADNEPPGWPEPARFNVSRISLRYWRAFFLRESILTFLGGKEELLKFKIVISAGRGAGLPMFKSGEPSLPRRYAA